ncbi:hypothetical protein [Archangium violaceum]|uniref:hypothetical protein n=1 Tax=Archangium violaceum TaxID=83451 RepID=UPI0037C01193
MRGQPQITDAAPDELLVPLQWLRPHQPRTVLHGALARTEQPPFMLPHVRTWTPTKARSLQQLRHRAHHLGETFHPQVGAQPSIHFPQMATPREDGEAGHFFLGRPPLFPLVPHACRFLAHGLGERWGGNVDFAT